MCLFCWYELGDGNTWTAPILTRDGKDIVILSYITTWIKLRWKSLVTSADWLSSWNLHREIIFLARKVTPVQKEVDIKLEPNDLMTCYNRRLTENKQDDPIWIYIHSKYVFLLFCQCINNNLALIRHTSKQLLTFQPQFSQSDHTVCVSVCFCLHMVKTGRNTN